MDTFFLTTFNKRLYDEYAKNLIDTYLETKQTVPLVCFVEEEDTSIYPQHDNIFYYNLFEEAPSIKKFIKRNKNRPVRKKGFIAVSEKVLVRGGRLERDSP